MNHVSNPRARKAKIVNVDGYPYVDTGIDCPMCGNVYAADIDNLSTVSCGIGWSTCCARADMALAMDELTQASSLGTARDRVANLDELVRVQFAEKAGPFTLVQCVQTIDAIARALAASEAVAKKIR